MKRLVLAIALAALLLPAASYGQSAQPVGLEQGWRAIKRDIKRDGDFGMPRYRVDACVREEAGYRVRCRVTFAWGLADDGRMTAVSLAYATRDQDGYHVTPRDYEHHTGPDGREPCGDSCPPRPQAVSSDRRDTYVRALSAYAGTTAWLGYDYYAQDEPGPTLVVASADGVEPTGVRLDTSSLDVGPRRGRAQVAYSRCKERADCELWRYDPKTKREFKLRRASSSNCREIAPALWRDTIVFYREPIPRRRAPDCRAGLYRQTGKQPAKLIHRIISEAKDIDVQGDAIAVLMSRDAGARDEVWLRAGEKEAFERIASQVVYLPGQYPIHEVDIAGSYVYWTRGTDVDGGDDRTKQLFRRPLTSGPTEGSVETRDFFSAAFSGNRFVYGNERGVYLTELPSEWET